MAIYMIGDLAKETGLSIHTLNYYLNIGLIKPAGQSERNRYRFFDDSTVELLQQVIELRKQKVSIKKIQRQLAEE